LSGSLRRSASGLEHDLGRADKSSATVATSRPRRGDDLIPIAHAPHDFCRLTLHQLTHDDADATRLRPHERAVDDDANGVGISGHSHRHEKNQ
jgi:hypothetical protein